MKYLLLFCSFCFFFQAGAQDLKHLNEKLEVAVNSGGQVEKVNGIYFADFRELKKSSGLTKRKMEKWFPLPSPELFQDKETYAQATNAAFALSNSMWNIDTARLMEFGAIEVAYAMYYLPDGSLYAVFYKFRKKEEKNPATAKVVTTMKSFLPGNPALSKQASHNFSQCYTRVFEVVSVQKNNRL